MPVPRRRHSKARRDRARTHKKLLARQTVKCEHCGAVKMPSRVCQECGKYGKAGLEFKTIVKS